MAMSLDEVRKLIKEWDESGRIKTSAYYRLLTLLEEAK